MDSEEVRKDFRLRKVLHYGHPNERYDRQSAETIAYRMVEFFDSQGKSVDLQKIESGEGYTSYKFNDEGFELRYLPFLNRKFAIILIADDKTTNRETRHALVDFLDEATVNFK